ncbi:MFS general substrate transporter [Stereum hirsutum FP-91666 SS1]|uniref:MFS general substrate transporter n=1 Tax=Stereum hirsutum (strain FP-91666) TaxID=721885 RepID=R7RWF8_STEHR|nr:MFS general substrate transporter [Stereum hirsutum FP-91666 SS1]EIM79125.1 MFS general substrate transporter [Stereum hirsutum FP-91666 SS1]
MAATGTTNEGTSASNLLATPVPTPTGSTRGARFWLIFLALGFSLFLSPLELTSTSTALPSIIQDLNGNDFIWIASSYTLTSTAILPMSGGLAEVFGRRPAMIFALSLFSIGSALCGSAQNMPWLIAARGVQGMGGGCILSITNIIISDLVPLKERGFISGVLGLIWAMAAALGPIIGGALADAGQWRWIFYLNLPICGVALVLVLLLLNVPTPPGTLSSKLARLDWVGNTIIVGSTTACVIALTWAGVVYPWSSTRVLAPLIIGLCGLCFAVSYDARYASNPLIPISVLSNRTTLSGYAQTFFNPVITLTAIYYLPTYYQACKGASAIRSGVELFGLVMTLGPVVILTGISVTKTNSYRWQCWVGWSLLLISMGLLSTLHADSTTGKAIGYPSLVGIGGGVVYAVTYFPVLAPLPVGESAKALAFFAFSRSFAGVWGVTVGGTILQNELSKHLPANYIDTLPDGVALIYGSISSISNLPEPTRTQVRQAFGNGIATIWKVMIGVAGAGFISCIFMQDVPMHKKTDEKWGLEKKEESRELDTADKEAGEAMVSDRAGLGDD